MSLARNETRKLWNFLLQGLLWRRQLQKLTKKLFFLILKAKKKTFFRLLNLPKDSNFFLALGEIKQGQTKFYDDLRRGITEYFQRLAKFQRTLSKSTKKIHRFWATMSFRCSKSISSHNNNNINNNWDHYMTWRLWPQVKSGRDRGKAKGHIKFFPCISK